MLPHDAHMFFFDCRRHGKALKDVNKIVIMSSPNIGNGFRLAVRSTLCLIPLAFLTDKIKSIKFGRCALGTTVYFNWKFTRVLLDRAWDVPVLEHTAIYSGREDDPFGPPRNEFDLFQDYPALEDIGHLSHPDDIWWRRNEVTRLHVSHKMTELRSILYPSLSIRGVLPKLRILCCHISSLQFEYQRDPTTEFLIPDAMFELDYLYLDCAYDDTAPARRRFEWVTKKAGDNINRFLLSIRSCALFESKLFYPVEGNMHDYCALRKKIDDTHTIIWNGRQLETVLRFGPEVVAIVTRLNVLENGEYRPLKYASGGGWGTVLV